MLSMDKRGALSVDSGRRVLLNVVASYGRSVFALLCGLFTAWWVLIVLGCKRLKMEFQ